MKKLIKTTLLIVTTYTIAEFITVYRLESRADETFMDFAKRYASESKEGASLASLAGEMMATPGWEDDGKKLLKAVLFKNRDY